MDRKSIDWRLSAVPFALLIALILMVLPSSTQTGVTTQLAFLIDGSGSISSSEFTTMRNGIAAALEDSSCTPHDGTLELTVIQFSWGATTEIAPTVITAANVADVANAIRAISQENGYTNYEAAIAEAQSQVEGSPNFSNLIRQQINMTTDGEPSTGEGNPVVLRQNSINAGFEEFDVSAIGFTGGGLDLLLELVHPQPGTLHNPDPWPPVAPGWVRSVSSFDDFVLTVCENFQEILPTPTPPPTVTATPPSASSCESTFSVDDEGWRGSGDAALAVPTWYATGGNPGGFVELDDGLAGGVWYWEAPATFLGDASSAYGNFVRFDLKQSSTSSQFDSPDVILNSGGLELIYDTANNPDITWTHYDVPLTEAGWEVNGEGRVPSSAEFQTVLANLERLRIRGEYVAGSDTGGLDNVILETTGCAGGTVANVVEIPGIVLSDPAQAPGMVAWGNNQFEPAPPGVTVTDSGNIWRYFQVGANLNNTQFIQATFDLAGVEAVGVQFTGDTNDGWARVLLDGQEVWRGNTYGDHINGPGYQNYVKLNNIAPGQHTIRVESTGQPGNQGGDDSTVYYFGFHADGDDPVPTPSPTPEPTPPPAAGGPTFITSDLQSSQVWTTAGSPYIIDYLSGTGFDVLNGQSLTIEAGVEVRFKQWARMDVNAGATLNVLGTASHPVIFTSDQATHTPGYWRNIHVMDGASAEFQNCEIAYAGYSTYAALFIDTTDPVRVTDCDIHHNLDEGVALARAGNRAVFTRVNLYDNGGFAINQGANTEPQYNQVVPTNNGNDGVLLDNDYTVSATLDGSGLVNSNFVIPYLSGTGWDISSGAEIVFPAGTTVKFAQYARIDVNDTSSLRVVGNAQAPVLFTSDEATARTPGYWREIRVFPGASADFDNCIVENGGYNNYAAVSFDTAEPSSMTDCIVRDNLYDGIAFGQAGNMAQITSVTLENNGRFGATQYANTQPDFVNVTLSNNGNDGVLLAEDYSQSAELDGSGLNGANYVIPYLSGTGWDISGAGTTISFTAGTNVNMAQYARIDVNDGAALKLLGEAGLPVTVSSDQAVPTAGWWREIRVFPGGSADFANCVIEYGGYANYAAVSFDTAVPSTMTDCTVRENLYDGVAFGQHGNMAQLTNVTLLNNDRFAAVQYSNSNPSFDNVTMTGNGNNGVLLAADYTESATFDGSGLNGGNFVIPYLSGTGWDISGAGTVIEFAPGTNVNMAQWSRIDVNNGATLRLNGTNAQRVNVTADVEPKTSGYWRNISVEDGGSAEFTYCDIAYGGYNNYAAVHFDTTASATITNCNIHDNQDEGFAITRAGNSATLQNVSLRDNGGFAGYNGGDVTPTYTDLTIVDNGDDGILLAQDYAASATLDSSSVGGAGFVIPYLSGTGWDISGAGTTVTFAPGSRVSMAQWSRIDVNSGAGIVADGVWFTAYSATPAAGWWRNITIEDGASADFDNCIIEHGGYNNYSAIVTYSSGLDLRNCEVRHHQFRGIWIGNNAAPVILDNHFYDLGGEAVYNSTPTRATVDARNNYWGVPGGPTHTGNPGGTGQTVSDGVLYDPWLNTEPVTLIPTAVTLASLFAGATVPWLVWLAFAFTTIGTFYAVLHRRYQRLWNNRK